MDRSLTEKEILGFIDELETLLLKHGVIPVTVYAEDRFFEKANTGEIVGTVRSWKSSTIQHQLDLTSPHWRGVNDKRF